MLKKPQKMSKKSQAWVLFRGLKSAKTRGDLDFGKRQKVENAKRNDVKNEIFLRLF